MKLVEHPTVRQVLDKAGADPKATAPVALNADWLRRLCLEAGADDVGFVELARQEISTDRQDILAAFPKTKALISFVCRMNREPIRSPARSVANLEFHQTGDQVNEVARAIVTALHERGVRALNPSMGFPMEMDRFPGKVWVVSHKPVAVAAGLGRMGIHRNVIHPKFGSFILLGTILIDAEVSRYDQPIDYNPCLECKLCVAACPTGAIGADGRFDFSACYTHNYREFMGGFTEWVERIADSKNSQQYRQKVTDSESASMWQSLSFGANYKAAYCLAVCPAGEEVIAPFLTDRRSFTADVVKPLQDKIETVYVVPGSDADTHVARRFPHKRTKHVASGLRPTSIQGFLDGLPLVFQRDRSKGLDATYHFTFTGVEARQATVTIRDKTIAVQEGLVGEPHLRITADSHTWLRFARKEGSLAWALLTRRIRFKGSPRLLMAFGNSFPS
nr:SCP2 sterol-binding domain-containing protein [Nitrospirota bacterium]